MHVEILILGAGPTGLGAAWQLDRLGHSDWLVLDRATEAGGLAGSVQDDRGYTWDMGGHIQFSHYDFFDEVMDELLGPEEWLHHERESWVWLLDRFVPYPFQNNLRYLPRDAMWKCVSGLIELWRGDQSSARADAPPANFGEWTERTFGAGLCELFMRPYNFKVWAYPLEEMAHHWIGDRVAVTDLSRVVENILFERDDVSWGPNNKFRFPQRGGTGEIWRRCAARLPEGKLRLGSDVTRIDTARREVHVEGMDEAITYDKLITTIPLDRFVQMSDRAQDAAWSDAAGKLLHSAVHIVGLGVRGEPRDEVKTKCWMYFPESDNPFFRATVFSNYSPNNVPDIKQGWSLMCEVSESHHKPVDEKSVVEETIQGALATRLVDRRESITHTFHRRLSYGYPTPSLARNEGLEFLLPALAKLDVYSRGRFGAWKYEVSNQDHSFMQGVECVDHLVNGKEEITVFKPEVVNAQVSKRLAKT